VVLVEVAGTVWQAPSRLRFATYLSALYHGRLDDELGSFWYIRGRPSEGHMAIHIALQKFIGTFSAGAAAWPLVPCAQPQSGCGGLMCSL